MRQKKGARGRKAKSAGLSLSYRQAEEEDMEIQRQLQEAHSRIAALKAQVKREQQMRRTREQNLEGKNVPATDMEKEASEDDSSRAERLHTELKELASGSSQGGSRGVKNGRRSSKERPRTSESSRSRMRHSSSSTGANLARPKTSDSSSLMSRSAPLLPQGGGKSPTKKSPPKHVRVSPPRPATSSGIPGVDSGRDSKKSPKMKRRPATASSSLSPTRKQFTEKHFSQAQAMPLARLQDLLKQKLFKEAIRRKGIEDHELVPRPPASFRVQANRASLLSPVEAQLHFEAFEKRRMKLLAMVLAEWEVCEGERKRKTHD